MTTLVTGAGGLLGANIVRALLERGGRVRALVYEDSPALAGLAIEEVRGDLRDAGSLARAVGGVRHIYHAAAMVSLWTPNEKAMREVNVEGTRNLLTAALGAGVGRVLHVSTVDALGLGPPGRPASEETPYGTGGAVPTAYARTKKAAEEVALSFASKGLDVVVASPTYMLGAWDTRPTSGRLILEIAQGRIPFYPPGGNNFADVEDVAAGAIAALEKGQAGRRYILAGENLTYRSAFRLMAEIVGVSPPVRAVPAGPARLAARLGGLWGRARGREPLLYPEALESGFMEHYFDGTRAREELGYRPRPIHLAIERAWKWFQANGYAGR